MWPYDGFVLDARNMSIIRCLTRFVRGIYNCFACGFNKEMATQGLIEACKVRCNCAWVFIASIDRIGVLFDDI